MNRSFHRRGSLPFWRFIGFVLILVISNGCVNVEKRENGRAGSVEAEAIGDHFQQSRQVLDQPRIERSLN